MREQALRARPRRRGLPKDRGARSAVADNVLDRQFQADGQNQKWVADFTYIWTAEGWPYAVAVLDLYSRHMVGWSMQESMTSQLVVDALMMAVWRRGKPVALPHHSDQGSQYTSEHFQKLLDEQGITCSMSRAGEVWHNSTMESFFSSLKSERTARKVYRTRGLARSDVFDCIECFYNPTRRHSTLGYVSPVPCEQAQEAEVGVYEIGSSPLLGLRSHFLPFFHASRKAWSTLVSEYPSVSCLSCYLRVIGCEYGVGRG